MNPPGSPRDRNGRLLVQPFPQPGPRLDHAYWELDTAANADQTRKVGLGNHRRLPRPWNPASCTIPELRLELWAWLDAVAIWLNHEYTWDTTTPAIPPCWPRHPHLVHEIAVLADRRRAAENAYTSDLLDEWHRYTLPAFYDRLRSSLQSHCETSHQEWPARGRHARLAGASSGEDRQAAFTDDLDAATFTTRLSEHLL